MAVIGTFFATEPLRFIKNLNPLTIYPLFPLSFEILSLILIEEIKDSYSRKLSLGSSLRSSIRKLSLGSSLRTISKHANLSHIFF